MKKFIVTIDTEGDNLWAWKQGDIITTENTKFLPRFQALCEKYGFKPVWLTNYEMIEDDSYAEFIADVVERNAGELGMHLHAWNTPPDYDLEAVQSGAPYLIEYPYEVMEEKIATMTDSIKSRTGIVPVSHRAGRWAMNDDYFKLLIKYGYKVDCSVTPHVDWRNSVGASAGSLGADYSDYDEEPYWVRSGGESGALLEVPMSIVRTHVPVYKDRKTVKNVAGSIYRAIKGVNCWFRPNGNNLNAMLKLAKKIERSRAEYIMFMLHSSELMPNGSPTFKTERDIDKLFADTEKLFAVCSEKYCGCTLKEYYAEKCNER